jgi:hypothetical protein
MGMVSFFTDMASSLVMPLLPFFIVIVLDQGVDKLGIVLGVTTLVSYLLRFVGGIASDKMDSNKQFLIVGYGLSAIAKPVLGLTESWLGVAGVRSGERLGKAVRSAPKDKLISLSAKSNKMGASLGLHKAIEKMGEVLGLVILLGVIAYFGMSESVFRSMFLASAIPGLLSILVLTIFVKEIRGGKARKNPALSLYLEPKVRGVIAGFIIITLFMFNEAFYLLLGKEFGLDLATILLVLIMVKATQMLVSKKVGRFIDKRPIRLQMGLGYLIGISASTLLLFPSFTAYLISFLMFGIHELIMLIAIRSYIGQYAEDKGSAYGFLYFTIALFSAASAYVIGLTWQHFGATHAIVISCAGMLVAGLVFFKFRAFNSN